MPTRREYLILAALALLFAGLVAAAIPGPAYTDAYYYFNAGQRLAQGDGLTDPYIALTYLDAPESLPGPSHTYWMPLTSLVVALAGGSFALAQVIFVLLWAALALLAFGLGALLGKSRRHAWAAGLLTILCPYYAIFLTTTDNFLLFGLGGALALLAVSWGRTREDWRAFALAGLLAGLAHLARADGLLLPAVLVLMALWPHGESKAAWRTRFVWAGVGVLAYLLVMAPWFLRNLEAIGAPLSTAGTATIWLRDYNQIASYPPSMSAADFFAWGWGNILQSRVDGVVFNLGNFFIVEGALLLGPFILIAVWQRRRDPFLAPVWVYALALHGAMALLFTFPGGRGSLFHSSTALLPWWNALAILGLDDAIAWIARRRKRWQPKQARRVFTAAFVALVALLTALTLPPRLARIDQVSPLAQVARAALPADAVVMSNSPPAVYYHTGLPGAAVPAAGLEAIRELAAQYGLTHLLLDEDRPEPLDDLYLGVTAPPPFLRPVPQTIDDSVRVYAIVLP